MMFMNWIFAYCDIPIINDKKLDIMISSVGVPLISILGSALLNLVLSDIDKQVFSKLPQLQYARFENEIVIQI